MKKEAIEVLKNRRCIRSYKAEQITEEELNAVLEAGMYAPTAMGAQAPFIVAVQDPDVVAKIDEMNAKIFNSSDMPHPYYGAPTILLILAPDDSIAPVEDCTLIAGNLLNAAYAAGLGSCWIHRVKEMFETQEGKELLKKWGLPENTMGVASVALGYADESHPEAPPRKEDYIVRI